ncbi:MAG TPA: TIGR01244 family sulfur transferase [Devosiaceae bacterium]
MHIQTLSADYGISGQIQPDDVRVAAQAGYKTIVCARPDNESWGQPSYSDISRVAEQFGIKTVYLPVSGAATANQVAQFKAMCRDVGKPVLGYCRSGARAATLYNESRR